MALYLRIKVKITTGILFGIIFSSFVIGLLIVSSMQADPVNDFLAHINNQNYEDARSSYKILVQYGQGHLEKLDEKDIIYREEFFEMRDSVYDEYIEIVTSIAAEERESSNDCTSIQVIDDNLVQLEHGLRLLEYASRIGEEPHALERKVREKINDSEYRRDELVRRCM